MNTNNREESAADTAAGLTFNQRLRMVVEETMSRYAATLFTEDFESLAPKERIKVLEFFAPYFMAKHKNEGMEEDDTESEESDDILDMLSRHIQDPDV